MARAPELAAEAAEERVTALTGNATARGDAGESAASSRDELRAAERRCFSEWVGAYAAARELADGADAAAWAAYDRILASDPEGREARIRSEGGSGGLPREEATVLAAIDAFAAVKGRLES